MSTFESGREFLEDLLRRMGKGEIQLPDFQRGWVWDDDHIKSVIASVARAFPIGAVMLLETGGEIRFQPRLVEGITLNKSVEPRLLILDGQQRLTSLYQATLLDKVVETVDARRRRLKRWYYIDMQAAVSRPQDLEEAVRSLPDDRRIKNFRGEVVEDYGSTGLECKGCLFPLHAVFDSTAWRHAFNQVWGHDTNMIQLFDRFERDILSTFKRYQVPTITLRRETPKEAVCQVFEKVNTGGVSLNAFELLTATFAADGFNLRDDWYGDPANAKAGRRQRLARHGVLQGLETTDFLQTICLLHTFDQRRRDIEVGRRPEDATGVSCKRATILDLPLNAYKRVADEAEKGFTRAARFLHQQKFFVARDLPYRTQLVPLAAIFARLGERWDEDGIRRRVARWYWCGVLGELYGSAVETRFARDLPETLAWVTQGAAEPSTVQEANFAPSRLQTLRTRNSAAYKGVHALLIRDGCLDFRTGERIEEATDFQEQIDIHHIFPRRWCEAMNIPPSIYNAILNKTAIARKTNQIIGGRPPSEYLERLQSSAGISLDRMDVILQSHRIEPAQLRADAFEPFYAARRTALLGCITEAMGKTPTDEVEEAVFEDQDLEDEAA